MSSTSDAIAALEALTEDTEGILELFITFPEELQGDKQVCEKALAKFIEIDRCSGSSALKLFAMFTRAVKKDVDVQSHMIDLLKIPYNSSKQGPFLAEMLDGSKDDAAIVHRCCSTWGHLWQVTDVLRNIPDALKADADFQTQFVQDVDLSFEATDVLRSFPGRDSDISFCTLMVEKCGVERRSGGMGSDTIDGSSVPMLYRQFSVQVQSDIGIQKLVFERCSAYGMPMLFQFWPPGLQRDPVVRGEFLNKCHDKTKMYLFKAFVEALPDETLSDIDLHRRFIETTGQRELSTVFAELPEASKNNLDLVHACIDNPQLTDGCWLKLLYKAFPDGVKREPQVQQRCLDRFSREQLREAFGEGGEDVPDLVKEVLQSKGKGKGKGKQDGKGRRKGKGKGQNVNVGVTGAGNRGGTAG